MYPHRIRLRSPWKVETEGQELCFRRGFHCPTSLDTREEVWLVVERIGLSDGRAEVMIDETPVGQLGPGETRGEYHITERLAPRCELTIRLKLPQEAAGSMKQQQESMPFEVRLEIRLGPPRLEQEC